jgi:phospholipid-binding lipoprotein MlaA
MPMNLLLRAGAGALLIVMLGGCATTRMGTPGDPLERMNRGTHRFNDAIDRALLRPVAVAYRDNVPEGVRGSVSNFLRNLSYPTTIVNNLLQLKLKETLSDVGRLALNTTIGIGGLFDPASRFGIPSNDEDFGQTLGRWGVPAGPYVVLPFLGPSSARDAPSVAVDTRTDPRMGDQVDPAVEWTLIGLSLVNRRSQLLSFDATWQSAYDPYAFIRDSWLQRREYQVRDGDVPDVDPLEGLEDPDEMDDPAAPEESEPADADPPPEAPSGQSPAAGASSSATSLMPASETTAAGTLL